VARDGRRNGLLNGVACFWHRDTKANERRKERNLLSETWMELNLHPTYNLGNPTKSEYCTLRILDKKNPSPIHYIESALRVIWECDDTKPITKRDPKFKKK